MKVSTTCLRIQEEKGRERWKDLGKNEQVVFEGSEMGKFVCFGKISASRIDNLN